jgi:spore coat protein CotH
VPVDISDLVFDRERVLQIDILMDPNDWDLLRFQARDVWDELGPGCFDGPRTSPYTFFPATVTIDGEPLSGAGVRKKGFFGSADFAKPALKIDFGEFNPGQEYLGMDRLTLNNAKQDPALVKQCLAYQLFRDAGLPASRCNFAHVIVNGQDMGVYVNVESIKKRFLARHFPDNTGNLYEGALSDFRPTWVNTFERKTNPDDPNRADLQAIVDALDVTPDPQLEAVLTDLVDLDAFYRFWAMEALISHWDSYHNGRNNFWIYFDPAPVSGPQVNFIPWGIDGILGNGSPFTGESGGPHPIVSPRSKLTRRLYLNLATQWNYINAVSDLLATVWNEASLLAEIDRMEALLLPYSGDISTEVQAVRDFVNARRAEVVADIGGGPPPWNEPLPGEVCMSETGQIDGTFNTTWGTMGTFPIGTGTLNVTIGGSPIPFNLHATEAGFGIYGTTPSALLQPMGLQLSSGTVTGVTIPFPEDGELIAPGTVDMSGFLIAVWQFNDPALWFIGWMVDGEVIFTAGGTTPGAPVAGSFSGRIGNWVP